MKRLLPVGFLCFVVTACSARKSDSPPAQTPAGAAGDSAPATGGAAYSQPPAQYGGQPGAPAPPPPSPATAEPPKAEATPATPTTPGGRALALNKASSDIEAAQRELDVAGSSCQNACRALGSMDRACGHLCQLTREDSSQAGGHDRCDDAKRRLYNARDKVRGSCGACPDNQPATDRNAPVPSMR
jgi:hypothetical protein